MMRWPCVTLPLAMPSTAKGTTSPSKVQTMDFSGRTQRKDPEPQRIDLGQGKLRMICGTISAMTSVAARPALRITAT